MTTLTTSSLLACGWLVVTVGVGVLRFAPSFFSQSPWTRGLLTWGKLATKEKKQSTLKLHVPKRWFWHFYFVGSLVCLFQLASFSLLPAGGAFQNLFDLLAHVLPVSAPTACSPQSSTLHFLALALLQTQLARRLIECLLLMRASPATMHFGHYVVGLAFYLAFALSLFSDCQPDVRVITMSDIGSVHVALVVTLFLYASYHQFLCHHILASLRSNDKSSSSYGIPRGDWFQWVCCPHYLAEILIYLSFALLLPSNAAVVLASLFVAANLTHSALLTRDWYAIAGWRAILPGLL
eukprot:m.155641 g.155641  ORF g.155641 m.155641 type:complete len:294 (+) comp15146_c8_seq1:1469-2350(+)